MYMNYINMYMCVHVIMYISKICTAPKNTEQNTGYKTTIMCAATQRNAIFYRNELTNTAVVTRTNVAAVSD